MEPKYIIALLFLAFFVAIISPEFPHEYSDVPEIPVELPEDESGPAPLMSSPDDEQEATADERPGWWKHTGHSHVDYLNVSGSGNSPASENVSSAKGPDIDIRILVNGQQASTSPGPVLVTGSQVTVSYVISNCGDCRIVDIRVDDDSSGAIGEYDLLGVDESITMEQKHVVQEGKFSSTARVSGFCENSREFCSDQSSVFYFGKNELGSIPEFPTVLVPVLVAICLALIFERRRY
ncbi:MAG: hypothetical protein JW705_03590 [Methanosarcinaceae archaeon]|nr:hypothetical protein [Methanosarcinaceae archaeon]